MLGDVRLAGRQLMDLPTEIIQLILEKMFCDPRLYVHNDRGLWVSLPLTVRLPRSLLVSKKYFRLAKLVALEKATICAETLYIERAATASLTVSVDFHSIQYLNVQRGEWQMISVPLLKAILDAVPRLRRLTMDGPDIVLFANEHWSMTGYSYINDPDPFTVISGPGLEQHLKELFEKKLRFFPDQKVFNIYDFYNEPGGVAINAWLARKKEFELCFVARIFGQPLRNILGVPFYDDQERHLWVSEPSEDA
jgi:hypothetical protein